jgi:hypothetical protein
VIFLKQKDYLNVTGIIFAAIALMHVGRLVMGWDAEIGDFDVPYWASFLGAGVAGFLAYSSRNLKK